MKRIYQLRIELSESNPKVWRRIQVPGDTSFSELHDIIQLSMGWENDHLYEFTVKKIRVYDFQDVFDDGSNPLERDSMDTFLDDLVKRVNTKFTYVYDFGDNWEHVIQVEKILPEEENTTYPVCLEGERACPQEDCGGIWRYQNILRILDDKDDPEYDEITEWVGEDWDPDIFDCDQTNARLQNYAEQWEDIYKETEELIDGLEGEDSEFDDLDDDFYGADEDNDAYSYDDLKKFSTPEDVLRNEYERSSMEEWIEDALEEEGEIENDTYQRLRDSGHDDQRAKDLILQALSIEYFYDLKFGTDHLNDRYEYNLQRLPETPQEIPRLKDALDILSNCVKGIPFSAIEYLQNDSSEEATSEIIDELRNHSDHQYCWEDCTFAPFWFSLAAEGHLCEALIDPVIQLYEENPNETDWLFEQGQYLIGKLAQRYPDLTAQKLLDAMEKDAAKNTKTSIFYLFDAFYFCDPAQYKSRLLALLERDDLSWFEPLAATVANLHIAEALPVLERKLEKLQAKPEKDLRRHRSLIEVEEAIQILKGEIVLDPDTVMPLSLTREISWQEEVKRKEKDFYENEGRGDDFRFQNLLDQFPARSKERPLFSTMKPYVKEEKPGRNEPCHCGSGKKYKKCCMDKDG